MLGIRSEEDKAQSRETQGAEIKLPKIKLNIDGSFTLGKEAELTVGDGRKSVTVYGDTVEEAINAPISCDDIKKSLGKLGNTPYEVGSITINKDENIIIRVSSLNALRRSAIDALMETGREEKIASYSTEYKEYERAAQRTAMFSRCEQIPEDVSYFDRVFVYLDRYKRGCSANGICLPPVILDSEWDNVEKMLSYAKESGVKYALVTNVGQIERVKKHGFVITADYRFNVFNRPCVDYLRNEGFDSVILSPELTLRQCKDMTGCGAIVYGNIPVMTTHKCIIKDTAGCDKCRVRMTDRTGASFYSEGIFGHRNVIYNSVPIYMADKMDTLGGFFHHFIFSDETREQCEKVISAYKRGLTTDKKIKRLK
jgi:putative protease